MWRAVLGVVVGSLLGCTLPQEPVVPLVEPVAFVMQEGTPPVCPLDRIEVVRLVKDESGPVRTVERQPPARTPVGARALVTQALAQARVEPSLQGYQGGGGEQVYQWSAGRVFTVYLSKGQATGIFLPAGERLVSGLVLDADAFDVTVERAGSGDTAYDAVLVRPTADKGEVSTLLLTESGRRYLLHFVIGQVGMLAVSFTGS